VSDRRKLRPQSLVMIVAADGAPCEHVRVVGGGVIDGNGSAHWYKNGPDSSGDWTNMEVHNCSHVEITGITLRNPANWNLHPWFSRDVWVHDMTLEAPCRSPSTDGIDPDSCDGVLIERVNITSGDDHIAIKSGSDLAGRTFGVPSRNITVRGNWHGCGGGISIGSECSGGVENVLIEDVVHQGPSSFHGVGIKTAPARGGYVRNVHYKNISFGEVDGEFITVWQNDGPSHCDSGKADDGGPCVAPHLTEIRNITYEDLHRTPGAPMNTAGPGHFLCGHNVSTDKNIGAECHEFTLRSVHLEPVQGGWGCFFMNGTSVEDVTPAGLPECFAQCVSNGSMACPVVGLAR
jgi:polygalacturonase